jgi:RimJ/RimL family protein N-acetyltransferase
VKQVRDLHKGAVRLRPLGPADLEQLLAARHVGSAPGSFDEEQVRRRLSRRIETSGRFNAGRIDFGIEHDGRLVGSIEARQPREGLPPGAYEVGISFFEAADRGRGLGTTALDVFTGYLFSDPDTHRVQASTWMGNAPMRRVLEKVGYTFEGVMRAFMPTETSERLDYALYAVTRTDWAERDGRGNARRRRGG